MNIKTLYINDLNVKSLYINGKQVKIGGAEPDCLCFTANTAGSTVGMQTRVSSPSVNLQYSTDGKNWSPFVVGTTTVTLANIGDKVWIKAIGSNQSMASGNNYGNRFTMTGSIAASGNVNSLLEEDEETARTMSLSGKNFCFDSLFIDCTSLTTPPELPATILINNCYENMFQNCSSLTQAPELPATTLTESCYIQMFKGCTSLTSAPQLPATKLAATCYTRMFDGCSSLKISQPPAPSGGVKFLHVPAGTTTYSYWNMGMFSGTGGTYTSTPQVGVGYYYYT